MKKFLLIVISSFLLTSCASGATDRNYIMGDSVEQRDIRIPIVP